MRHKFSTLTMTRTDLTACVLTHSTTCLSFFIHHGQLRVMKSDCSHLESTFTTFILIESLRLLHLICKATGRFKQSAMKSTFIVQYDLARIQVLYHGSNVPKYQPQSFTIVKHSIPMYIVQDSVGDHRRAHVVTRRNVPSPPEGLGILGDEQSQKGTSMSALVIKERKIPHQHGRKMTTRAFQP
jgi:hypothetical protein